MSEQRQRPIYESEDDRDAEQRVVEVLQICWRCKVIRLPHLSRVDYKAIRGSGSSFIEIKCRTNAMRAYPTYMISLRKIEAGIALAESTPKHSFCLVVRWTDAIGFTVPKRGAFDIATGGRRDRGDAYDVERVAHIPIERFTLLDAQSTVHREWWAEYDDRDRQRRDGMHL